MQGREAVRAMKVVGRPPVVRGDASADVVQDRGATRAGGARRARLRAVAAAGAPRAELLAVRERVEERCAQFLERRAALGCR